MEKLESVDRIKEPKEAGPQGQGSSAKPHLINKLQAMEVADESPELPEPQKLQLGQRQSSMLSDTDMQYRKLLTLTHQGFSNMSMASNGTVRGAPNFSRFFIIKSFTEEDVHKAIKYQVWSSTANGNRILDQAFTDVQESRGLSLQAQSSSEDLEHLTLQQARAEAEVYLFFSVNKSRHFCGVARMAGPVLHGSKQSELWRTPHKWPGSIKLQWLWIKDVPNTQFIHVENPLNENKPVC